jgi:predicted ATPase
MLMPRTSPEDMALLAGILSLPPDGSLPALDLSVQRRREATFATLVRQFAALARTQPVLVLAEDVQWLDPTSRELLEHLFELCQLLPLPLMLTCRPEFEAPWAGRAGVSVLTRNRLPPRETAEIALRLAATAIPQALIERLVSRGDGVPLFIEELTRAVLESGSRMDGLSAALVPDSLQASLLSRLGWLPAAKAVARIGSVIGRSFPYELAAATADIPDGALDEGPRQLVEAGLASRRGEAAETTCQFKHALVEDTAYQSMPRPRRAGLHAAIGAVPERDAETAREDPALIAHHRAEAGMIPQAVRYFPAAAEQMAARCWRGSVGSRGEAPRYRTGFGGRSIRNDNSFSRAGVTSAGAPISKSSPCWLSGNKITSRIFGSSASIMTMRSIPGADPPCGGAP